jgi:hypothetical protein
MELENVNPNGDHVVASNLNNIKISFWKIVIVEFKNKHNMLSFLQDVVISYKT